MPGAEMLRALLDSLIDPVVFVDTNHVIRYMNDAAIQTHQGGAARVGRPLFSCHTDASKAKILEYVRRLEAGEEDILIVDNDKERIFIRAVRNDTGRLLGYYERYEPPPGKDDGS